MTVFPLFSLFPLFASIQYQAGHASNSHAVISNSQPTRCGHTLRGVHCRGLAGDVVPSTPAEAERQKP